MDIQKSLSNLPGFPWSKYPGEKHLPGYDYAGPGTRLDLRLDSNDIPLPGEEPVDRDDAIALKHDIAYRNYPDLESKHEADRRMIEQLKSLKNLTFKEKFHRAMIIKLLQAKLKLGVGLSPDLPSVKTSSHKDSIRFADEIHKQFRKPKLLLKVKVFNKNDIWSADLIEMKPENGYKYVLNVIDLYSRYVWAIPLKNKTGLTVKNAFESIGHCPKKLWVDKGKEFYNKHVKSLPFEIYSTYNEGKAVVIERFNRTLKNMLFKLFTANGNKKMVKNSS